MTRSAIARGATLVLWPESSTPFMLEEDPYGRDAVRRLAVQTGSYILVGSDDIERRLGTKIFLENDANAAAYGEYWVGSGRDFRSMVLLTLGTGVGCGIVIGDLVVQGAHSHGGEAGHVIIDSSDNARMCGCGWRGHLEAYASATAVVRRTEDLLAAGRRTFSAGVRPDDRGRNRAPGRQPPAARMTRPGAPRGALSPLPGTGCCPRSGCPEKTTPRPAARGEKTH